MRNSGSLQILSSEVGADQLAHYILMLSGVNLKGTEGFPQVAKQGLSPRGE